MNAMTSTDIQIDREVRMRNTEQLAKDLCSGHDQGLPGLRRKRIQKFRTQKALAEACGIDRQTYNSWETGRHWPSAKILPILASALGCTIEDLFLPDEESEGY